MSMAIKYNMQKKAKKMACGGKMMADGGAVEDDSESDSFKGYNKDKAKKISDSFMGSEGYAEGGEVCHACGGKMMADGGEVDHDDMDMVGAIIKKRSGQSANDVGDGEDADKMENQFDYLVNHGDEDGDSDYSAKNSGDELGDAEVDEEERDVVSQVMKSRKKKDRLPNPR